LISFILLMVPLYFIGNILKPAFSTEPAHLFFCIPSLICYFKNSIVKYRTFRGSSPLLVGSWPRKSASPAPG
jgi:hypothetical protein